MIRIDRSRARPDDTWFARAEAAARLLKPFFAIPFLQRIQRNPEFDGTVWQAAKPTLKDLFWQKCAYCESRIHREADIDHFRPRTGAIGTDRDPPQNDYYWWLAYEWTNLYYSCDACRFSKGRRFPVDGARAEFDETSPESLRREKNLLLDPCVDEPDEHLAFDGDLGKVVAKTARGRATIEILSLNRENLVAARRTSVELAVLSLRRSIAMKDKYVPKLDAVTDTLDELLSPSQEFAAAVRQAVRRQLEQMREDVSAQLGTAAEATLVSRAAEVARFVSQEEQHQLGTEYRARLSKEASEVVSDQERAARMKAQTRFITQVVLYNVRLIEDMTIVFPTPTEGEKTWVVLLGENATGKSTILKAIALALMGEANRRRLKLKPNHFLRRGTEDGFGFVEVHLSGVPRPFRLFFRAGHFHFETNGADLCLLPQVGHVDDIPSSGQDVIIVAAVDGVLHFRVFDNDGNMTVDADETRLASQATRIEQLRNRLEDLWPPHELTGTDKGRLIMAVMLILDHTNVDKNQLYAVVLGYGGTRLLDTRRRRPEPSAKIPSECLIDFVHIDSLFDPFRPLINAKDWYFSLSEEQFGLAAHAVKDLLAQRNDSELLRRFERPREVALRLGPSGAAIPLEVLSDGYQSVIALVTDIVEMMQRHWNVVKDSEGVILLDELDVHLHPRWKAEIIGQLRATFPRIQFVVTTHDALCLLGTRPGEVHVLRRESPSGQIVIQQIDVPRGLSADQVLTGSWFGLGSTLDNETLELLNRHRQLLRDGRHEDDPERQVLEGILRHRMGTYADTSLDRLAQSAAAEFMGDDPRKLGPGERAAIRGKLLDLLRTRREGG
jgi:uncharacterized protein (TIGR02646 family)